MKDETGEDFDLPMPPDLFRPQIAPSDNLIKPEKLAEFGRLAKLAATGLLSMRQADWLLEFVRELIEALTRVQNQLIELADRPEDDATDGAHPAWWRGHDHGAEGTAKLLLRVVHEGGRGAGYAAPIAETVYAIEKLREARNQLGSKYDVSLRLEAKVPLYDAIKGLLIDRGWKIDPEATERPDGELHEFLHPETGMAMAYVDAIYAEQSREISRSLRG